MKTPLNDRVNEICSKFPTASQREAALKELLANPPAQEGESSTELAERIADSLVERLKPKAEDNTKPFYPTMQDASVPDAIPFEGWDEDLKAFPRGFYEDLKESE